LIKFASGLLPRKFVADDPEDRIIYEEGQEVSEMYFFLEAKIVLAMNAFS
jgi:hypothetical protein